MGFAASHMALLFMAATATTAASDAPSLSLYLHLSWSKPEAALRRLIPAASAWGYNALVLEIGGNVELSAQGAAQAQWSKADLSAVLELARANGLEVIPCSSLLSHPECGPRQATYVDPTLGLRLWEPGVYDFLERYVSEVCDLFGRPRYFHARLDEAAQTIAENSQRLGVSPDSLLANHITRLNEIVSRQGARLIVYHDMLLPAEQVPIGTALGGAPLDCWKAVETIPRQVILNFWLYDFLPQHAPAVEFFTGRGFEVWVSPWMAPEAMCKWAAERAIPVLETTWCDPTSLAAYEGNLRAVVLSAEYTRNPQLTHQNALPWDPLLRAVEALNPPLPTPGALAQVPLPGSFILEGLPETVEFRGHRLWLTPLLLSEPQESVDDRLAVAQLPLSLIRSDGTEHRIDGVNRGRGEAELILYTPAFGPHTNTNMFGGEAVITDGIVSDVAGNPWGAGGYVIPPGGCVISGHCAGDVPGFMASLRMWEPVRIVDAQGQDMLPPARPDDELQDGVALPVDAGRPVRELWLFHATLREMSRRRVGQVVLVDDVGRECAFDVQSRRHVASYRVPRWLMDADGRPADDSWLAWSEDRGYGDARCLWATRFLLDQPVKISVLRIRPTPAGAAAGWVMAAVAVGR